MQLNWLHEVPFDFTWDSAESLRGRRGVFAPISHPNWRLASRLAMSLAVTLLYNLDAESSTSFKASPKPA
jgi:hypothetical protein